MFLPSIQRVKKKRPKKCMPYNMAFRTKGTIVKTKGTGSPLWSLTYTASHHCRSTVVATHVRGDARSGGARSGAR